MAQELEHALALVQENLIPYPVARARTGLTTTGLDDKISRGTAPAPIRIAGHVARFFVKDEFESWLATYQKYGRAAGRPNAPASSHEVAP